MLGAVVVRIPTNTLASVLLTVAAAAAAAVAAAEDAKYITKMTTVDEAMCVVRSKSSDGVWMSVAA